MGEGYNYRVVREEKQPFFKRHDRSFALLGALIVFTTFVVKDGLQEHISGVVASLELGNYIFEVRGDNTLTRSQINRMETDIEAIQTFIFRQGTPSMPARISEQYQDSRMIADAIQIGSIAIKEYESSWKDSQALLKDVPNRKAVETVHEALEKKKNKLTAEMEHAGTFPAFNWPDHLAGNTPQETQANEYAAEEEYQAALGTAVNLISHTLELQSETLALRDKAIESSRSYKDWEVKKQLWIKWTSYLLYTIGWGITFCGRLVGADGASSGDE